jgi:hypothetical protein
MMAGAATVCPGLRALSCAGAWMRAADHAICSVAVASAAVHVLKLTFVQCAIIITTQHVLWARGHAVSLLFPFISIACFSRWRDLIHAADVESAAERSARKSRANVTPAAAQSSQQVARTRSQSGRRRKPDLHRSSFRIEFCIGANHAREANVAACKSDHRTPRRS